MPGRRTASRGVAGADASAHRTATGARAALDRGRATARGLEDAIARADYPTACALGFEVRSTIRRVETALASLPEDDARRVLALLELYRADVADLLARAPRADEPGAGSVEHERAWLAAIGARDPHGPRAIATETAGGPDDEPRVARLHLLIDVDVEDMSPFAPATMLGDLARGLVGHAWISLEYPDATKVPSSVPDAHRRLLAAGPSRYANPIGFWPKVHGSSVNPLDSFVPGEVRHPDRAHEGAERAIHTWDLTQRHVDAVIAFADGKRGAPYSTYRYNCTTFARDAILAAGLEPPPMTMFGVCMPNAVFAALRAQHRRGAAGTAIPLRPTKAEPDG